MRGEENMSTGRKGEEVDFKGSEGKEGLQRVGKEFLRGKRGKCDSCNVEVSV